MSRYIEMNEKMKFSVRNHVEGKLKEPSLFDWRHLVNELVMNVAGMGGA